MEGGRDRGKMFWERRGGRAGECEEQYCFSRLSSLLSLPYLLPLPSWLSLPTPDLHGYYGPGTSGDEREGGRSGRRGAESSKSARVSDWLLNHTTRPAFVLDYSRFLSGLFLLLLSDGPPSPLLSLRRLSLIPTSHSPDFFY